MIEHLKRLFQGQARQDWYETCHDWYETFKALLYCKMVEGTHVLKMIEYIKNFQDLDFH